MAEKRAFHRSGLFYILSGIFLVVLTAGFLFWRNYKYKLVNKKLDLVTTGSKGLYQILYKNLVIDEVLGNISAEEVELQPDSQVYQSLVMRHEAPENLFYIRIPKLQISGVKTPKALLNKEISAHLIRIENANMQIQMGHSAKEKKSSFTSLMNAAVYRELLEKLKSIEADSILLENTTLTMFDGNSKSIRCKATGVSILLTGMAIDRTKALDSSRILFSKELTIHCEKLDLPDKNKVYDLQISGLGFDSRSRHLHTDRISYKPQLSESDFAGSYNFSKDRLNIEIGSLDIRNINRQAMMKPELVADTLEIRGAFFRTFRDKSVPHDSVDRTDDYPQEVLMRLQVPVKIKKILVSDSYIEYKEKNDKSDSSGKVSFFHVQAVFSNVTNMLTYIEKNPIMRLQFHASFLNQTPFDALIMMRLNDRSGHFQLDAKMGNLDAVALNPLLRPMALAELKKGEITGLRYHMDANNRQTKGILNLTYSGLSIKLLKKDQEENKYKTKGIPTLAANFVLKDSNPQNGQMRIGNIDYKRDTNRSIFNLMWKSLFSGIKQVAM